MDKSTGSFRELLDNSNSYPILYVFKFIIAKDKLKEIEKLFPKHEIKKKTSKSGKYISTTINIMAKSTDEIVGLYEQSSKIEGIISL